jgi:protoheme IX farnesyltransferase
VRSIPAAYALFFAFVLGVGGVALLYFYTNVFTLLSALVGFFIYVAVYGYAKRHMQFAVHLGALAGATPPLVGYTAVSQQVDTIGIALFTLLMVWQMPHFLSIAIYRAHEYKTAGIYVFPLRQGVSRTKWLMLAYVVLFAFAVLALAVVAPVGQVYFLTMTLLCLGWLMLSMQGFFVRDDNRWARRMFLYSLVVITLLCLVLIV